MRRVKQPDVPELMAIVGTVLITVSLWGVDWRLALGMLGLLLMVVAATGEQRSGRRR